MKNNHILKISIQLDEHPAKEGTIKIYKKRYEVVYKDDSSNDVNRKKFLTKKSALHFMRRKNRKKKVKWGRLKLYKDDALVEDWSYRQKKIIMPVRRYVCRTTKEYPLHFICEKEECNCQYIAEIGRICAYQSGYMYESVCPVCGHRNSIAANPWINGRIKFYCDVLGQREKMDSGN